MVEFLKGINKKEVLKYLGYRGGELSDEISKKIDIAAEEVLRTAMPKVCSVRVKIASENPLRFENTDIVLNGEDAKKHLEVSDECIFMAATLGSSIDKLIKKISVKDMAEAVIYDACASSAIENLCENYEKYLAEKLMKEGRYLTDRFSPGYGDLPIESQKDFCAVTGCERKIGLMCSRDMLLVPTKSVTAFMGVSDVKQEKRHAECENCKLFFDCEFRKRGVTCYEQIEK